MLQSDDFENDTSPRERDGSVDLARDAELVRRCQGGDQQAFQELYERYHRRLYYYCLRQVRQHHEAEDATQEVFSKAWRALPNFSGERRFYPWLTVIASNVCTDMYRKSHRTVPVSDVPQNEVDVRTADSDEQLIQEVDSEMAVKALGRLSRRHQRIIALHEGSEWSTREIADLEGISVSATETLLWRARQALKREFADVARAGGRYGIGLGVALAGIRRFVLRSGIKTSSKIAFLPSLRSPIGPTMALAGTLAVTGAVTGVVTGAVWVGSSNQTYAAAATPQQQPNSVDLVNGSPQVAVDGDFAAAMNGIPIALGNSVVGTMFGLESSNLGGAGSWSIGAAGTTAANSTLLSDDGTLPDGSDPGTDPTDTTDTTDPTDPGDTTDTTQPDHPIADAVQKFLESLAAQNANSNILAILSQAVTGSGTTTTTTPTTTDGTGTDGTGPTARAPTGPRRVTRRVTRRRARSSRPSTPSCRPPRKPSRRPRPPGPRPTRRRPPPRRRRPPPRPRLR